MARLCNLLSWFFFALAPVLVTLAFLAVPENAFADPGSCLCGIGDWACVTDCCQGDSGCCTDNCFGDADCLALCQAGPKNCKGCGNCAVKDCSGLSGLDYLDCILTLGACWGPGNCSLLLPSCANCSCRDAVPPALLPSCACRKDGAMP